MIDYLKSAGGRKFVLTVLVIIVLALRNILNLDDLTIKMLATVSIGGVGGIALEDGLKAIAQSRNGTQQGT